MAGRTDLLIDLEAALELPPVIFAERPFEREGHFLGGQVELMFHGLGGGLAHISDDTPEQRPQQDADKAETDQETDRTCLLYTSRCV